MPTTIDCQVLIALGSLSFACGSSDETSATQGTDPASPASTGSTGDPPAATSMPPATSSGEASTSADSPGSSGDVDGGTSTGSDAACGRPGNASPPGRHAPNPIFDDLADNDALDLGAYTCADRVPEGIAEQCRKITDFSRFNYDPDNHRILMFGGGHAATGRTDVDVFDFGTTQWESLYPSMGCDDVAAGEIDPRGFHISTGHPVARHTYDMSVIAQLGGVPHLLLLSTEGFAGHCHQYNAPIGSVAALPLQEECPWEYSPQFDLPWSYSASAEFDPVSGMVIVIGSTAGAGEGGLWVYDPATAEIVAYVDEVEYGEIANNLVYFPPNDTMYFLQRDGIVRELVLARDDWAGTRSQVLASAGPVPSSGAETGYAYDAHREVIGGSVVDGTFHVFDPIADTWCAEPITVVSDAGAAIGTQTFHNLDYDPVNNIYVFIADGDDGRRTWAYRYRN